MNVAAIPVVNVLIPPGHQPFFPPTLKPADITLDPVHGNHYLSNDSKLEITIPAGAITAADAT
jgi:hypothetical protein